MQVTRAIYIVVSVICVLAVYPIMRAEAMLNKWKYRF